MENRIASVNEPMMLAENDLPALYQSANQSSVEAQEKFLRWSKTGLIMVVLAAAAGALIGVFRQFTFEPMGLAAAIFFSIALFIRMHLLSDQPERRWYGGRAAAESAKTLAWRYAAGGVPFQIDRNPDDVDEMFCQRLEEILTDLDAASLAPPSGETRQITQRMRSLRAGSLEERKQAYSVGRIEDQIQWYARKAQWNRSRARSWNYALLGIEFVGLGGALVIMVSPSNFQLDMLGLFGALAAAGASWLQTKQHANLAEAYAVAAHELSAINERIPLQRTEEDWARFVNEAEDAISREHVTWRASKTTR